MKTIFVSSTFSDMHAERDAIQNITLPILAKEAAKYGDSVTFCDLRWGIDTDELSEAKSSQKVLDVCLDEIDRCNPPMVVIIGERYGWIPPVETIEEVIKYREMSLEEFEISVTALEIEYGALSNSQNALFYFREFDGDIPEFFLGEDEEYEKKLKRLKQRIYNCTNGNIKTYKLKWQNDCISGVDDFAKMVAEDLKCYFISEWTQNASLSPFEKELKSHWHFLAEKEKSFSIKQDVVDRCIEIVQKRYSYTLIGKSGSGKSTIFSKIAYDLKKGDSHILPVICGLTENTSTALGVLKFIVWGLEKYLEEEHFEIKDNYKNHMATILNGNIGHSDCVTDYKNRLADLCYFCKQRSKNVVIMLDGLECLTDDSNRTNAIFIPRNLCENVLVFATCSDDIDIKHSNYGRLRDIEDDDKEALIRSISKSQHKELSKPIIKKIKQFKNSDNPLYVKLIILRLLMMNRADYISIKSRGDGMSAIIEQQLSIIDNCPDSLIEMSACLIDEAAKKINYKLIRKAMEYISASRHGFRRNDLANLVGKEEWNELDFVHFVSYLNGFFVCREDGRFDFSNSCFRKGFYNVDKKTHNDIFKYLKSLDVNDPIRANEIIYHCICSDNKFFFVEYIKEIFDNPVLKNKAAMDVLSYSRDDKGEWICELLKKTSSNPEINLIHFISIDVFSGRQGERLENKALSEILPCCVEYAYEANQKLDTFETKDCLSICFNQMAKMIGELIPTQDGHSMAVDYYTLSAEILEPFLYDDNYDVDYALCVRYSNLAYEYIKLSNESTNDRVLDLYNKSKDICLSHLNESDYAVMLSHNYNMLSSFYFGLKTKEGYESALSFANKAIELLEKLKETENSSEVNNSLANSYVFVANVYGAYSSADFEENAIKYNEKALLIREEIFEKEKNYSNWFAVASSYKTLGDAYYSSGNRWVKEGRRQIDVALEYYNKTLKEFIAISRNLKTLDSVYWIALAYASIGGLYSNRLKIKPDFREGVKNLKKGVKKLEKVIQQVEGLDVKWFDLLCNMYLNMGNLYLHIKEYSEANHCYEMVIEHKSNATFEGNNRLKNSFLSMGYQGLGYSYYHIGGKENLNKAYEYLSEALKLSKDLCDESGTPQNYFALSGVYEKFSYYYFKKFRFIKSLKSLCLCLKYAIKSDTVALEENNLE